MSYQMANELKSIRAQMLDLLKRIESLEDFREEQKKRRPVLTLPPKTQEMRVSNVQK